MSILSMQSLITLSFPNLPNLPSLLGLKRQGLYMQCLEEKPEASIALSSKYFMSEGDLSYFLSLFPDAFRKMPL
jgi:hypothetical protein